jgi:ferredoxin
MLRVRLDPARVEFAVKAGERVLDALDAAALPGLPTACRAANCGLCLVRVEQGIEALCDAGPHERRLLEALRTQADHRLGCQITALEPLDPAWPTLVLVVERGVPPRPPVPS